MENGISLRWGVQGCIYWFRLLEAVKKDERGLPETFSKRLLFDNRWLVIVGFVVMQGIVWHCSCVLGCVKCACGFGAQMLWAAIKGMAQNYLFNMDPLYQIYVLLYRKAEVEPPTYPQFRTLMKATLMDNMMGRGQYEDF